jgi:hypothetical protein
MGVSLARFNVDPAVMFKTMHIFKLILCLYNLIQQISDCMESILCCI